MYNVLLKIIQFVLSANSYNENVMCLGGKSSNGACILTFPDSASLREISDDEYKNLVTYLTSIPT